MRPSRRTPGLLSVATLVAGCSREASHALEPASDRVEPKGTAVAAEQVSRARTSFGSFLPRAEVATFRHVGAGAIEATTASGHPLHVVIPPAADGAVSVRLGSMGVEVRPEGFVGEPVDWAEQIATYASVRPGVDAFRVVTADGVEDFYRVESPASELSFSYRITLTDVAALRLVAGSLELLDREGTPRLHSPAPIVRDARGLTRVGSLSVRGCAYDTSPIAPWGRPIVPPGATTCTVVATIDGLGLAYPVLVDPSWKSTTSTKRSHAHHRLLRLGAGNETGKILLVGGTGSEPLLTELFDPATKTWALAGALPATLPFGGLGVGMNAVVLSSGHVVAAGGYGITSSMSRSQGTTVVRDPLTGVWKTASTMTARAWHAMVPVTVDGKAAAFSIGGQFEDPLSAGSPALAATEYYFPEGPTAALDDTWNAAGALATGRSKLRATVLGDGRVLAVGGEEYTGAFVEASQAVDLFDPTAKSWSAGPSMVRRRTQAALVALAGSGAGAIAAGGSNSPSFFGAQDTLEYFDGTTWTLLTAKMSARRWQFAAARLDDGRLLLAGGESEQSGGAVRVASAELFAPGNTPTSGTLGGAGALGSARKNHDMVALPGLGALVAGGIAVTSETTTSDVFDVAAGSACSPTVPCPGDLSCVDSVCCTSASCPTGQACNVPGDEGVCVKAAGSTCGNDNECASGFCVTGVCCETACTGPCQACDGSGKCGVVNVGKICDGDAHCGRRCDATGSCALTYEPIGTACGDSATDGGALPFCTVRRCDGEGSCVARQNQCGFSCTTSVQCDEAAKTCTAIAAGIKPGFCVIDGICRTYGDQASDDPCKICEPPVSKTEWTIASWCTDAGSLDGDAAQDSLDTGAVEDTLGGDTSDGALPDAPADSATNAGTPELPTASACGCRVPRSSDAGRDALALLALVITSAARRRRRIA